MIESVTRSVPVDSSEKTVIVVEDEPDMAEMFAEMVRLMGLQVIKLHSGIRAIDLIAEKKPWAVLLDMMMPDVSGLEVLRHIHRDPRLSRIPVIIVSAKSTPSDIRKGLDAGASFYLSKPVSFVDLKRALDQVSQAVAD
jgi:two-component system, OmpR family, phosphate regulon response regulator PhoB